VHVYFVRHRWGFVHCWTPRGAVVWLFKPCFVLALSAGDFETGLRVVHTSDTFLHVLAVIVVAQASQLCV